MVDQKSNYTISVIIPSYNRAALLRRGLLSVLQQTYQPMEIIVVDDHSEDNTQAMVLNEFPQVVYRRITHAGVSKARNTGIKSAKGNWIALLDSDDEWQADKLERQVQALREHPGYALCHTDEIWIRKGKRVNPMHKHKKQGGYIYQHCLPLCAISPSSVLIQKSLFDEVGLFDETLPACEDYDLWLRVCVRFPVLYLDTPLLVKYGGHADQLSQRYWGMDRFRISALRKMLDSGCLGQEDYSATLNTLVEKCNILINGAQKRDNADLVAQYTEIKQQYLLNVSNRRHA